MQGIPSRLKYHYDICWAETESSGADEGLVAVLGDLVESVSRWTITKATISARPRWHFLSP